MNQDGNVTYTKCYFHDGPAGVIVNVTCFYPVCGRFLRVIKQPTDDIPLTLCEVEVYGPDPQIRESSLSIFLAVEPFSDDEHLARRQIWNKSDYGRSTTRFKHIQAKKNVIYDDRTQHAKFRIKPNFEATKQYLINSWTVKNEMW